MSFKEKFFKYKNKYLNIINKIGGVYIDDTIKAIDNSYKGIILGDDPNDSTRYITSGSILKEELNDKNIWIIQPKIIKTDPIPFNFTIPGTNGNLIVYFLEKQQDRPNLMRKEGKSPCGKLNSEFKDAAKKKYFINEGLLYIKLEITEKNLIDKLYKRREAINEFLDIYIDDNQYKFHITLFNIKLNLDLIYNIEEFEDKLKQLISNYLFNLSFKIISGLNGYSIIGNNNDFFVKNLQLNSNFINNLEYFQNYLVQLLCDNHTYINYTNLYNLDKYDYDNNINHHISIGRFSKICRNYVVNNKDNLLQQVNEKILKKQFETLSSNYTFLINF